MRASIVIATHNEGAMLARTVESCIETCPAEDYEIVVADDASTDGSVDAVEQRFPTVRVVRHERRRGASPTKALGAKHARGDVLVFLDAHTKVEPGAVTRLVDDIESLDDPAIVTPAVAALRTGSWRNDMTQVGHGYGMDLLRFEPHWLLLDEMQQVGTGRQHLYESPALLGAAFAISRELYDKAWGFDPHMRSWGVEDLDLGLKCWQLGHQILHDPDAVVGHRFQDTFTTYAVPVEHVLLNKLRMARKNFTHAVWADWLAATRVSSTGPLAGHPEGLWAHTWQLFDTDRASAEQEHAYLHARRSRDEFDYAERFGLSWPKLAGSGVADRLLVSPSAGPSVGPSHGPSPSPPPTPTVEIQVNNTPATNDDLVLLRCQHPARHPTVTCRIRLTSNATRPVTVVLHDPRGRLLFPDAATVTLVLPVSKAFVAFQISGQQASAAIGDARIEARVNNLSGQVAGTKPVTVVSFGNASLRIDQGGNYKLVGNTYTVTDLVHPNAVDFAAQATIQPAGVNCSAPQLANIRVGFMQDASNFAAANFYTDPTVTFLPTAPHGKHVVVPVTISDTFIVDPTVQQPVNDGEDHPVDSFPLFGLDPGETAIPLGCTAQGTAATSSDTPNAINIAATFSLLATATDGTVVGTTLWQTRTHVTRTRHFRTFCVTFDSTSAASRLASFCALRQASWDINLDSANANQHASVNPDGPATADPVARLPIANNAPLKEAWAAVGPATKTFISP
jgi:GT2 family glycosyltransferase